MSVDAVAVECIKRKIIWENWWIMKQHCWPVLAFRRWNVVYCQQIRPHSSLTYIFHSASHSSLSPFLPLCLSDNAGVFPHPYLASLPFCFPCCFLIPTTDCYSHIGEGHNGRKLSILVICQTVCFSVNHWDISLVSSNLSFRKYCWIPPGISIVSKKKKLHLIHFCCTCRKIVTSGMSFNLFLLYFYHFPSIWYTVWTYISECTRKFISVYQTCLSTFRFMKCIKNKSICEH